MLCLTVSNGVYRYLPKPIRFSGWEVHAIVEKYKDISFDAYCECYDSWISMELDFSYDGKTMKINGVEYEKYKMFMEKIEFDTNIEALAEEVGIDIEQAYSFLN